MLQKSPNRFLFQQENRLNCFIFVAIQVLSRFSQRKAIQEPTSNQKIYSTVSMESTILIFEIFRSGIAVAIKQAPTAKRVASRMGMTGIEYRSMTDSLFQNILHQSILLFFVKKQK